MAVQGSGASNYITVSSQTRFDSGSVGGADAWIYLPQNTIPGSSNQIIMSATAKTSPGVRWEIYLHNVSGFPHFGIAAQSNAVNPDNHVYGGTSLAVGWHHVFAWCDNHTAGVPWELWVDGVKETNTVVSGTDAGFWINVANTVTSDTWGHLMTTAPNGTPREFLTDAYLAEVRLWKFLLSNNQIKALARGISPAQINPTNSSSPDLLNWWALWNNTGPYPDYAGRGVNFLGTLTGTLTQRPHAPVAPPWPGLPGRSSFVHAALAFTGTPAEIDFSAVSGTLSVVVPTVSLTADAAVMAFHPPEGGVLTVARRGHGYKPKRRRMPNFSIRDAVQYWRGYPAMDPANLEKGRTRRRKRT